MRGTCAVLARSVAIASGLSLLLLGLGGTASADPPGTGDCAGALVMMQGNGLSTHTARDICKGKAASLKPDLDTCATALSQPQEEHLSPRKARQVCLNGPGGTTFD